MIKFIFRASLLALFAYGLALVALYLFQRSFIYFPPADYYSPDAVGLSNVEIMTVTNSNNHTCEAWWIPPSEAQKPVVMFFHGNGSAVYSNHDIYQDLQNAGYGILAVGYPGYPGSEGKPTQAGIIDAAMTQYDWLIDQNVSSDHIVFYGTSIGSGVAAQLSTHRQPALLIMEAPFTSILEIAQNVAKLVPVSLLLKDTYRSDMAMRDLNVPLIWLHGTGDKVVPYNMGQELYDAYDGPKSKRVFENGQHTNLWGLGGKAFIIEALEKI